MIGLIQPLSEEFIYASPEALGRSCYRICRVQGKKPDARVKVHHKAGDDHVRERIDRRC